MSINKIITCSVDYNNDIEILDDLVKTASVETVKKESGIVLPEGFKYDPDYLYLSVKAVSAGEYWGDNKNNDYFPEEELKKFYKTFLSAHVFKNHDNKKIEGALGSVLSATWRDSMKSVYLLLSIDRRIAPTIVRGYEKGYMTDVSMGCRVDHVVCSYCGKVAKNKFEYCDHLKTMRGQIMDNGKKVCEINIGPKFHDISTVLNGAERTAKVTGIFVNGDKVAFLDDKNTLEKTAGIQVIEGGFSKYMENMFEEEKLASETSSDSDTLIHNCVSSFEKIAADKSHKKENRKESVDKAVKDSIDKVQNKLYSNALSEVVNKGVNNLISIVEDMKLHYEHCYSREECLNIGISLRKISKETMTCPEQVFCQFLRLADLSGIALTPLEIHDIFYELMDLDSVDLRKCMPADFGDEKAKNAIKITDGIADAFPLKTNLFTVVRVVKNHLNDNNFDRNSILNELKQSPADFENSSAVDNNILSRVMPDMIAERSCLRPFCKIRIVKVLNGDAVKRNNGEHFLPSLLSMTSNPVLSKPSFLTMLLNAAYQKEREENLLNDNLNKNLFKVAGVIDDAIEKTAKNNSFIDDVTNNFAKNKVKKAFSPSAAIKRQFVGLPLFLAYSNYQRSRLNNGDDISNLNRYIAENPANAYATGALFGELGIASAKAAKPRLNSFYQNKIVPNVDKVKNIFNSKIFKKSSESDKDAAILKTAAILLGAGEESTAEDILYKNNMDYKKLEEYLKLAQECIKIEIEKNANEVMQHYKDDIISDALLCVNKTKRKGGRSDE